MSKQINATLVIGTMIVPKQEWHLFVLEEQEEKRCIKCRRKK